MRILMCFIMVLILASCAVNPPATGLPLKYGNDCLPQAIAMTQALHQKGVDADVLILSTHHWSHAVCVYMYPVGQNTLWCWDYYWKSLRIRAWREYPLTVAAAWLKETSPSEELVGAEFLK